MSQSLKELSQLATVQNNSETEFLGVGTMEKRTIEKRIRIYDESLWQFIDKLLRAESFNGNFNEVINQALKIGLPRLYELTFNPKEYYKRVKEERSDGEIEGQIRDLSLTIDELSVQVGIIKYLAATLFNVTGQYLDGKSLTSDMLESGVLSSLPRILQEIENEMNESARRKRSKKQ